MDRKQPRSPTPLDPSLLPDRPLTHAHHPARRALTSLALSVGGPIAVTLALAPFDHAQSFKIAALVFLVPVVGASLISGMTPGIVASILSAALLEVYFTEPAGTFGISRSGVDIATLASFVVLTVGLARMVGRQTTDRRQMDLSQRRLAFLAGANELLQRASLDFDRTVNELAHLSVPGLADWCTIDVRDDDGRFATIAIAYGDLVRAPLAENLIHQNQPDPNAPAGLAAVVRTGAPEIYPVVNDEVIRAVARDATHAALLRGLGVRSLIIVPLFVRGEPIGAVKFASVRHDRRYTPEELTLAEDLSLRAGSALENVRLYQARTREARALQRSLLPSTIPAVEGLEVVARFEPAGSRDLVGGDFYDVFQGKDGRWLFIVGDVCGRGVEAAALTGLARHTLRAVAMHGESVIIDMLQTLNEAIMREHDNFCTLVLASVALNGCTADVRLVRAGHPSPLLVRADGRVEIVGTPGSLLGVLERPTLSVTDVVLNAGDSLVLYSDGVLDERVEDPEALLAAAAVGGPDMQAKDLADRVADAAPAGRREDDDRAVLVFRVTPQDSGVAHRWT